nr:MAG TPA: hypothetical protein [Caudoviricetes sp.]
MQNYSAKSCKIATNIVILINFCSYIFKTIIIHTQEVTGSSPAVSTKKVQESQGFPDFLFLPRLTLLVMC